MRKIFFVSIFVSLMFLCSCAVQKKPLEVDAIHDLENGGIFLRCSADELAENGVDLGDSVNINLSSGGLIEDVPVLERFDFEDDKPAIVISRFAKWPVLCLLFSESSWEKYSCQPGEKAAISINTKGRYLDYVSKDVSESKYDSALSDIEDAVQFEELKIAGLNKKIYVSSSAVNPSSFDCQYVDNLISENNINFVIDIADSRDEIICYLKEESFNSPAFRSLFMEEKVLPLRLGFNISSNEFKENLFSLVQAINKQGGPILIMDDCVGRRISIVKEFLSDYYSNTIN